MTVVALPFFGWYIDDTSRIYIISKIVLVSFRSGLVKLVGVVRTKDENGHLYVVVQYIFKYSLEIRFCACC